MKPWLQLLKLRITTASTVTTFVGYVLARGRVDGPLTPVLLGILLQACGSAALNHVQDAGLDRRMGRTAGRPIPSGRVSRRAATVFGLALLVAGTALIWLVSPLAALLGVAAAVVYNGIYTPLKRVTPFAALPGALIGALPPVVGWVAAGGYLSDPTIHEVAFFFFIWQIPHFWLLLLYYEKDYEAGGMPSLFDRFDRRQIVKLTFVWIAATCVTAFLMPLFRVLDRPGLAWLICGAGVLVIARSLTLLRLDSIDLASELKTAFARSCRVRFMEINTFALLVSALLVTDALM